MPHNVSFSALRSVSRNARFLTTRMLSPRHFIRRTRRRTFEAREHTIVFPSYVSQEGSRTLNWSTAS